MNKKIKAVAITAISAMAATTMAQAASITIDPTATKQEIVGFGGASVYYQSWLKNLPAEDQEARTTLTTIQPTTHPLLTHPLLTLSICST